jgi:hypothetical protein
MDAERSTIKFADNTRGFKGKGANGTASRLASIKSNPKRERLHPTTSDMNYTAEETSFLMAMDRYRTATGNMFPTYCQTLRVAKAIGYVLVQPQTAVA